MDNDNEVVVEEEVVKPKRTRKSKRVPRMTLYNPNKYVVPVSIIRDGIMTQVNLRPKSSIDIDQNEVTDSVLNLTSPKRQELVIK